MDMGIQRQQPKVQGAALSSLIDWICLAQWITVFVHFSSKFNFKL